MALDPAHHRHWPRSPVGTVLHECRGFNVRDPFWPAQLAVLAAIALQLALPERLVAGPRWLLPAVEGVLFVGLVLATPHPAVRYSPRRRVLAMAMIAVVSAVNTFSLVLLAHYLLAGGKAAGKDLIGAGAVLWLTNILLFSLWFWELDSGGPVARYLEPERFPDFMFPQMSDERFAPKDWHPRFPDYLYLAFTNATAFSPTDAMPLTPAAKSLMALQSLVSLVIVALVVSRAVNILS